MNYKFYNLFAFSTSTASSASASRTFSRSVDMSSKTALRSGFISLPACHEANGVLLNVLSEDLDICVPDAPNLIIEPITEVDSVHLDHGEWALDTTESLLSTSEHSSISKGNVDDGRASDNDDKGNAVQAKARCMKSLLSCTPTFPLIDSPPLVQGVNQFFLCVPNQRWMGSISVQDNNDKKMVASLGTGTSLFAGAGTASKKSNAVRVKDKTPEVTPELICTPALLSIGSLPLIQGVNHFLLYVPNQWWMGSTSGQDINDTMEVALGSEQGE
ncbi:hypothetical protein B0H14DRAFT_2645181 [Mycena olivaceomarginata]|nr:hypothetical protein B0H14DRAFT_2645181 [Mycena olivaceomarginata]